MAMHVYKPTMHENRAVGFAKESSTYLCCCSSNLWFILQHICNERSVSDIHTFKITSS